jgi:hypothetical protein
MIDPFEVTVVIILSVVWVLGMVLRLTVWFVMTTCRVIAWTVARIQRRKCHA